MNSPTPESDDPRWALIALRIGGPSTPGSLAPRWRRLLGPGLSGHADVAHVGDLLAELERSGLAIARPLGPDAQPRWSPTAAGARAVADFMGLVLERRPATDRARLLDAAREFDAVNDELKELCSDFQVRWVDDVAIANDHADPDYDADVISRLGEFHRRCHDIIGRCDTSAPWMGGHGDRLDAAVRRVEAGELNWFTSPSVDSYHQVWFELHEILLTTLGRTRHARGSVDR